MNGTDDLPDSDDDWPTLLDEIPNRETGVGFGARRES